MENLDDAHAISPELLKESKKLSHDTKKLLRKLNKQRVKDKEDRYYRDEPVYCPICGAFMRPYSFPHKSEEEAKKDEALYCKACGRDMTPTVKAMKQFMKDYVAITRGEDVQRITEEDIDGKSADSAGESPVCDNAEIRDEGAGKSD